jgi:UDP-N-acetylglucosamine acyltransferase
VGGGTTITQDVLPFSLTSAKREIHAYSLNRIGLERSGFTGQQLRALQHAYRVLLASRLNTSQALDRLRGEGELEASVAYLVAFIERSQRGVIK